jgi:hypothetical protein
MSTPTPKTRFQRWLGWALLLIAAGVGMKFGYDFGKEVSGMLFGWLMAANAAVFCALMTEGALSLLWRALGAARKRP